MPALLIKRPAENDITALPLDTRARIITAIQGPRETPFPHGTQKLRGTEHQYRLRVGDYRILYTLDAAAQLVTIYRVKHGREAYR